MKPRHTLPAPPRSPPAVAARTRIVSAAASCTRACELSLRSRFGDDLLVEPSHGVDSERGEIEVDRLYPESPRSRRRKGKNAGNDCRQEPDRDLRTEDRSIWSTPDTEWLYSGGSNNEFKR